MFANRLVLFIHLPQFFLNSNPGRKNRHRIQSAFFLFKETFSYMNGMDKKRPDHVRNNRNYMKIKEKKELNS
jgi:hypothetical protein